MTEPEDGSKALLVWISKQFSQLEVKEKEDANGISFLAVANRSCHPVLMTLPSVYLNIIVKVYIAAAAFLLYFYIWLF